MESKDAERLSGESLQPKRNFATRMRNVKTEMTLFVSSAQRRRKVPTGSLMPWARGAERCGVHGAGTARSPLTCGAHAFMEAGAQIGGITLGSLHAHVHLSLASFTARVRHRAARASTARLRDRQRHRARADREMEGFLIRSESRNESRGKRRFTISRLRSPRTSSKELQLSRLLVSCSRSRSTDTAPARVSRGRSTRRRWRGAARLDRAHAHLKSGKGGETGIDDDVAAREKVPVGALDTRPHMFGTIGGRGPTIVARLVGCESAYHVPVFVLTHHKRAPVEMEGGTVFHFVTEGIERHWSVRGPAGTQDIRLGGGVSAIRQYLQASARRSDALAVEPILSRRENLLAGLDLRNARHKCTESVAGEKAVHYMIARA